jgi:alpha-N-acetylgalactosaminidase
MKALGDYYHSKGAKYALYTAESPRTCGGYPASADHEMLDAQTFADWGVECVNLPAYLSSRCLLLRLSFLPWCRSYMKVDGCGPPTYYDHGYKAMGAALEASGRPIEYSCSWPAYINGGNETKQPFATFIEYGCNGWRNWDDIQCNWKSLGSIIDHWGDYGLSLQPFAGPGHWHDMDMLLIGSISGGEDGGVRGQRCVTLVEEMTQMAICELAVAALAAAHAFATL